ncbi:MAG TPA: hypothetical protein VJ872_14780 [Nocardioides sp.]|nr:hypothetical protein [Nocardioides sp.]
MASKLLGVDVSRARWLTSDLRLRVLGPDPHWLRVPIGTVNRMLPHVTRLVADLPSDTTPDVVWVSGADELLVHTDTLRLEASPGVLMATLQVACDQLREPASVTVPFATGTDKAPRGLFLATYDVPTGPPEVVTRWADALRAFAWESVITLASEIAAASGTDGRKRPLVVGAIGAGKGVLQVMPKPRAAS